MTTQLAEVLEASIRDRKLLNHPFYQRWEAGALSREDLRFYAEQYRFFEQMLPTFLEELAVMLPDGLAQESVLNNLKDEVAAPSHLELFERFASFYGAAEVPISPAMRCLVDAYSIVLQDGASAA